jgi:hypothetical protein
MTDWIYSVVLIIPAELQTLANQLAEGLGHGPNNFSAQLSTDGQEPITHYGCRAQAQQSFIDLLTAAAGGELPVIPDMDPADIAEVLTAMISDISTTEDGYTHFNRVLSEQSLLRVEIEL